LFYIYAGQTQIICAYANAQKAYPPENPAKPLKVNSHTVFHLGTAGYMAWRKLQEKFDGLVGNSKNFAFLKRIFHAALSKYPKGSDTAAQK